MMDEQAASQALGDPDVVAAEVAPDLPAAPDRHVQWRYIVLQIAVIALGAAIGANLRFGVSLWAAARFGSGFPVGTLLINVVGSLVIGIVMGIITTRLPVAEPVRLFIVTGLLGGFTTFSSFSYETYTLASAGNWLLAAGYVVGSVMGGLVGVILGMGAVRLLP